MDRENGKSVKRQAAEARQAAYDKMTLQQKLDRLDAMFGKDQGAKKVRAKIAKQMANPHARTTQPKKIVADQKAETQEEVSND